jgi:hypothetical protein
MQTQRGLKALTGVQYEQAKSSGFDRISCFGMKIMGLIKSNIYLYTISYLINAIGLAQATRRANVIDVDHILK